MLADAHHASAMGEPARWLDDIASRRAAAGESVEIIEVGEVEDGSPGARDGPAGVQIHRPDAASFEAALGAALERDPDVVHVAASSPLGARVVEILRELPVLLDVHDFWPICPRDDLLRLPRLRPCGEHFPYSGCSACAGLPRMRLMEERMSLALSAGTILCHSSFARARLNAGLRRRVEVVPYGVDTERYRPRPRGAAGDGEADGFAAERATPRVLFLGAPEFARGSHLILDLLVALRARVPGVEIVIAASHRTRRTWGEALISEARGMGIADGVRVLDTLAAADRPRLYRACQVAIAPAVGYESGGLALLEAMASEVPLVASPVGAIQDIVLDGEEGLLVDGSDIVAFADAVHRLLADPGARAEMGAAARARIVRDYTIERSLARLTSYYDGMRDRPRQAA
jgi:glycosyltransferase involved in cell wall biosynthesis